MNKQLHSSDNSYRALARLCAFNGKYPDYYYACSIQTLLQICGRCAIEMVRTIEAFVYYISIYQC